MEALFELHGNVHTLRVKGDMTIYTAEALKTHLLNALCVSNTLEIDLSAVEEMDSAGMQLLVVVKREAQRLGKKLSLVQHSPATMRVLDLFNMSAYFGDPVIITARQA
ncbi:MAG: anti-sigma factor antagonist [Methylococcaceae bacterium]|nr:MAG: anti-sigma factor antagonist [Methylococcaceae bacterium]